MAARNLLIGKQRHTSRSDREREKLQSQISTYAVRHHADQDIQLQSRYLAAATAKLEAVPKPDSLAKLDCFIDAAMDLVDRYFAGSFDAVFPVGEDMRIGD